MLDEPDTSTDAVDSDLPTPPRGRRAASRPAGPPKPVAEKATLAPAVESVPDEDFEAELQARMRAQLGVTLTAGEPAEAGSDSERTGAVPRARAVGAAETVETTDAVETTTDAGGTGDAVETMTAGDGAGPAEGRPARQRTSRKRATDDSEVAPNRRRSRRRVDVDAGVNPDADVDAEPVAARAADEARVEGDPRTEGVGSAEADAAEVSDVTSELTEDVEAGGATVAGADAPVADVSVDEDADEEEPEDDSDEGADGDDSEDGESEDPDESTGNRRRRRRRGGRRRRRSGAGDSDDSAGTSDAESEDNDNAVSDHPDDRKDDTGDDDTGDDEPGDDEPGDDEPGEDNGEAGSTTRRRRRRRRRRGEDTGGDDDPDTDVVVKVREPRRSTTADEVTGIEGSTRMEAKRQRRRDGRAAGRRRTPILSEAEFLARRESVQRTMVIRQSDELAQIAVIEDSVLVEHYVDRASATSLIGNVYLGRVQNVLPSMEAAFIDIGRGRNAVLYAGEVDWDSFGAERQQRKVENVLKSGQTILVQATKDPVGAKGARLTNNISLPGRYIVYSPGGHLSGISRKLPDTERKRLKGILSDLVGEDSSVIVRTAAEGASEDELVRDVNRLKAQWEAIEKKVKGGVAPAQLYAEPDATVRIVRDLFTEDFGKLIIDGNGGANDAYDMITAYVHHVAPHLAERIERWDDARGDLFAEHRIDEQIAKALERKVYLPSGGSLVIDRTEAMTVIDVNTGKFTGSGGNLEATVTSNNLEAAEEVVRQLRLRDIGGIIVIDFIDMVLPSNRELLLRRLVECLGRDRTRHQVAEVTSLGLVQMTRKKIGTGLAEAFTEPCEVCKGRGFEIHDLPVESQSQADGGERRGRRGRGRAINPGSGNGGGGSGQSNEPQGDIVEPAQEKSGENDKPESGRGGSSRNESGQPSPSTSGRSRRRSRGRSNDRDQAAPAGESASDELTVDAADSPPDASRETAIQELVTEEPVAEHPVVEESIPAERATEQRVAEESMPEESAVPDGVEPPPADAPQPDVFQADPEDIDGATEDTHCESTALAADASENPSSSGH